MCDRKHDHEFENKLKEVVEHFSGLIDEETAKMLTAYYFGSIPICSIKEAKKRKGRVTIEGAIKNFEIMISKNGDEYCRAIVEDEEDVALVYFWEESVELFKAGDINKGDIVRIRGIAKNERFYVNSGDDISIIKRATEKEVANKERIVRGIFITSDGEKSLILLERPEIFEIPLKIDEGDEIELKLVGDKVVDVKVIGKGSQFFENGKKIQGERIFVRGVVVGLGELRKYKGKDLAEITIKWRDEFFDVILWGKHVNVYNYVDIGDEISIFNGYIKTKGKKAEIHCGRDSIVKLMK